MDIQVINEIANQTRQASLSQVRLPVSTHAQVKALKGNSVPAQENPESSTLEDSPDQVQDPVTPEISSVARAASTYSATVGDGLNSDELNAIQNLAGKVRIAVSEFLSQPGLEQAESATTVVASNPEAVEDLTLRVAQAVDEALSIQAVVDESTVEVSLPSAGLPGNIPGRNGFISQERITNGAESNNPVVTANPAADVSESSSGDFRVAPADPVLQDTSDLVSIPVETPVNRPVEVPQQEPASRPETVAANPVEIPLIPEVAVPQQQSESRPETASANQQEVSEVTATRPVLQNTPANTQVQAPVNRPVEVPQLDPASRPETVAANQQVVSEVTVARPALQNVPENTQVQAPVNPPVVQQENVNRAEAQEPASRPEISAINPQEVPTTVARPQLQNAQPQNVEAETPVVVPAPSLDVQGSEANSVQTIDPEGTIARPEEVGAPAVSGQSNSQPASNSHPAPAQANDLFAQESGSVNPENVRNVNELVGSVVNNEFTSEAKKIFSEPKVIRTVADLADFILERLQEIIATKQQQPSSGGEVGIS